MGDVCPRNTAAIIESPCSSTSDGGGGRPSTVSVVESSSGIRPGNCGVGSVTDCADSVQFRHGVSPNNGKKKALGRRCKDVGQKWCQKLRGGRTSVTGQSKDDLNLPAGNVNLSISRRSLSSDNNVIDKNEVELMQQPSNSTSIVESSPSIITPSTTSLSETLDNNNQPPAATVGSTRALNGGYSAMFLNSVGSSNGNSVNRSASSQGLRTQLGSALNSTPTPSVVTSDRQMGNQLIKNRNANTNSRRMMAPSLFPCFKKRQSSDSESDVDSSNRGVMSIAGRNQMNSVSRDLVQRLKVSANEEGNSSSGSGFMSHFRAVNGMIAEPYPVHTQIEYTHYLVPDLSEITNAPYYWGVMDRFEAERLLEGKPEGTFLLRDSAQSEYLFSVSFRRYGRSLHARIEQSRHRFSFDSHDEGVFSSETVTGLIDHYKNPAVCLFFEPQLSLPLKRQFPFSLQHLCRAAISQTLVRRCEPTATYGAIQSLNLPKSLAEFIEEYHYKHPVRVRKVEHTMASIH